MPRNHSGHPHDVAGLDVPGGDLVKDFVYLFVVFPIDVFVVYVGVKIVAQGPKSAVAVTFVIVLDLLGRQKDGMEIKLGKMFRYYFFFLVSLRMNTGPSDPVFLNFHVQRTESRGQPSFASGKFECIVACFRGLQR
jgi:hypothetical protein